jgi:peptidoglycan/LPS O-acetylase OafA/YrhL
MNLENNIYRPDIDGLKAIAVLFVIIFNFFPGILEAGFMGIDIFFVISGFLITNSITYKLNKNEFSIKKFYYKRIIRILPSLTIILSFVMLVGFLILFHYEYKSLAKHILGTITFVENFILYHEVRYFELGSKLKPLLHIWSLSIGEQFYIFYPLFLLYCIKKRLNTILMVSLILTISLINNLYQYKVSPNLVFYFPNTRFWELLSGCLLYLIRKEEIYDKFKRKIINKKIVLKIIFDRTKLNNITSIIGLIIICLALTIANDNYNWPGLLSLLTIIGTILIINAGPNSLFNKYILSNKKFVYIGKISYLLYLWHWPLYSFLYITYGDLNLEFLKIKSVLIRLLLIIISVLLSAVTYRFIEKPIRFNVNYNKYILKLILINLLIITCSIYVFINNGLPKRDFVEKYAEITDQFTIPEGKDKYGIDYFGEQSCAKLVFCRFSGNKYSKTIAIVGDSHALFAYPALKKIGVQYGFNTALIGNYIPSDDIWYINENVESPYVLNSLLEKNDIVDIFIFIRGSAYLSGINNNKPIINKRAIPYEIFKASFQKFINILVENGKNIYIFTNNPEFNFYPKNFFKTRFFDLTNSSKIPNIKKYDQIIREQQYNKVLSELINVKIIDILDIFCPNDDCIFIDKNIMPLYYDDDHLSIYGNEFLFNNLINLKKIDFNLLK